ncbi:MAG: hypothetical protein NTV28_06840 [Propionibacteriales bacterium]|nr:hypothetical protein [Propionibacteriales bacterium]
MITHSKKLVALVAATLAIGVVAGLVVGGSVVLPWQAQSQAAQASEGETPAIHAEGRELETGDVDVDRQVEEAQEIALGKVHSQKGAVAAFSSYAVWIVGSSSAQTDPQLVPEQIGQGEMNPADAQLLAGMQRSPSDRFDAEAGVYRVLGHAGDEGAPDQVMVEVAAPLTMAGRSRWAVIGGVVRWSDEGWVVASIQPRDLEQPESATASASELDAADRARTLEGLGWQLFDSGR